MFSHQGHTQLLKAFHTANAAYMLPCAPLQAYFVVDQCDHPLNKALTMAAYLHVCFQNISVNTFFLSKDHGVHPDVLRLVIGMAVFGGASAVLVKLPW